MSLMMGRKNRSERSKCTSRVIWTTKQFNLFIDICLQGTAIGKRSGGGWGENGWSWLQNEMETAGVQFTKTQLKHKWDWMQQQWKLWKELIGKETGLEWDPIKGTIVASDEWWNQKVKENSNVGKLREKGIGQELFSKYETLFMDTKATGKYAYAPSCGVLLTNTNETKFNNVVRVEGSGDSEEDFEDSLNKLMQSETVLGTSSIQAASRTVVSEEVGGDVTQGSGKKQKRIDVCSSQPKQNKKVSKEKRQPIGAGLLSEQVRELKKSMDNRTSTLRATFGDKPGCSIKEIMEDVLSLPNIEEGSEFHLFCTLLLEHKSKREMYVTLKNAESKWKWLQYHYGLWTRGLWKPGPL